MVPVDEATELKGNGNGNDHGEKDVKVSVDSKKRKVEPGTYKVSAFKELVEVPAEKELDQIIGGQFVPLDDNADLTITGGEEFISHSRSGGSS